MLTLTAPRQPAPLLARGAMGLRLCIGPNAFGNALGNSIVEANWGGNGQQGQQLSQSSQDAYNPAADPDNIARAQHFAMNSYAAQDVLDPSQPRVISDASSGSNGSSGLAGSDSDWNGSYDVHKFKIFMDRYREAYPGSSDDEVMTQYDRMHDTQSSNSVGDSNGATGEVRAIGALDGFFTFDKPGQFLKGVGLGLKAPVEMVIGAGNLVSDAYGFTAGAITGEPYQAQSGLVQSIQSQGLVATAGDLFANTVKSLPGIAQVNSLYRNDMVGLGQSLPGLMGAAGGLKVFGGDGFVANSARVNSEIDVLQRIAQNNRAASPWADLRQAYEQARGQVDFAHIEADVRLNTAGQLQKAQGGHFSTSPRTQIIPGTETVYGNGVIRSQVNLLGADGNWYLKTNNGGISTLTPTDWSLAQAKGKMSQAFLNRTQIGNQWFGESSGVRFRFNPPNNTTVMQWRGYPVKP